MKPSVRAKGSLLGRIRGAFLSASAPRAEAEAIALGVILYLGVFLSSYSQPDVDSTDVVLLQVLVVGPLCAMLAAARMRLGVGGWRASLLREEVAGVGLVAAVTAAGLAATTTVPGSRDELFAVVFVLFLWNGGAFAFFRVLAYLWPRWVGLRRSRLRWEMTHTTLTVVAAVSSVVILVAVPYSLLAGTSSTVFSPPTWFATILPLVGILIFLTLVALALILPPAALVSYFAARRTTRRLESLAHGTSGLREGNFAIRVEIDGEDEVSDLQRDFNAMAGDLQKAMHDLRSERDNVERLLRTQRELVANVSHELRTPVATMRGYLESALNHESGKEGRPIPEDVRSDLEVMGREVIRLQRLIDDLFVLSRTETGSLPLEVRPTDVAALLSRCAEAASEGAWRTGRVEVIHDTGKDLPPAAVDEGRLEQVVRNLLANAVRHTPPGGIVALGTASEADSVVVEVKDTGEGVPAEDLGRIFERFHRSDEARRLDHSGAGLGLALVKELTEAMNGSVRVESEPGFGSRFILRLPRA